MRVSLAISHTAEKLIHTVKQDGHEPDAFEVLFGKGSIEALNRPVLRDLTALTTIHGVPVEFPEEPGPMDGAVWFRLRTDRGGAGYYLWPEMLNNVVTVEMNPSPPAPEGER